MRSALLSTSFLGVGRSSMVWTTLCTATLLALTSCIEERLPVTVPVVFEGASSSSIPVEGGVLELDTATALAADLRFESAPDVAWVPRLLPVAHAHPGHDFAGSLRAELLGEWTLDLLGGSTDLGIANGFEGDLATARFDVGQLQVTGLYTPDDGTPIPVELDLPLDRAVVGIGVEPVELSAVAPLEGLVWTVDLQAVFAFTPFADSDGDGRITPADQDVTNTLVFGATSIDSWAVQVAR